MRLTQLRPALLTLLALAALPLTGRAEGPYSNRDYPDPKDPDEPTYPIPYQKPTVAEITADLVRILGYVETAMPGRIVEAKTGAVIDPASKPVATAIVDKGPSGTFSPLDYTMGVVHSGMLAAAKATGDHRFSDFTASRLKFLIDSAPYFKAQANTFDLTKGPYRQVFTPASLDDCGALCAALIKARLAGVGPDTATIIKTWSDFVSTKQVRLADGTLCRHRPQPESLWADDFYMGAPALAYEGKLTGDAKFYDDAANDVLGTAKRLYQPATGLFAHGWNADNPDAPAFYWGRANGWAVVTLCDVLDVLPANHPARPELLRYLRESLRGIAGLQSGSGLWHQMLDRNDSYLETSASAMFVYALAHAINEGWISAATYGSIAQAGWCGLTTRINAKGEVEGTCVGTTFASDQVYYYARPVSAYAPHGYGPMLLAGSEMIRLLKNPRVKIDSKLRTYHYVPEVR